MNAMFAKDKFWALLQEGKDKLGKDVTAEAKWLTDSLIKRGQDDAIWFHIILESYLDIAVEHGIRDAASLMCHDLNYDKFLSFRCWLIAQGKKDYLAVMKNPDYLAELETYADCSFGFLTRVAEKAYEELTGGNVWDDVPDGTYPVVADLLAQEVTLREGIEFHWNMQDIAEYCPRLWKKYGPKLAKSEAPHDQNYAGTQLPIEKNSQGAQSRNPEVKAVDGLPMVIESDGDRYPARIKIGTYVTFDNLAVEREALIDGYWESWDTLTVNLTPCSKGPNYAFLDVNNCGQECVDWLKKYGFGSLTGAMAQSGFVRYPEFLFTEEKLREVDLKGYERHVRQWRQRSSGGTCSGTEN